MKIFRYVHPLIIASMLFAGFSCNKNEPEMQVGRIVQEWTTDSIVVEVTVHNPAGLKRLGFLCSDNSQATVGTAPFSEGVPVNNRYMGSVGGLEPSSLYYIIPYAITETGVVYGQYIPAETLPAPIPNQVGDVGPAGGIVFYSDGMGGGYEVYPAPVGDKCQWGCTGTTISTASNVGAGATNTANILATCSDDGIAAFLVDTCTYGGYTDWYLPSSDELYYIWINLQNNVDFPIPNGTYWSSTESASTNYARSCAKSGTTWSTHGTFMKGSDAWALAVRKIE